MDFVHKMESTSDKSPIETKKMYTICGVKIMFPYKAYPSQITMMDKIVKCLTKKQNCLLESPTGSGKSLALLCASLAWQRQIARKISELEDKMEAELNHESNLFQQQADYENNLENAKQNNTSEVFTKKERSALDLNKYRFQPNEKKRGIVYLNEENDFDDFKPPKKHKSPHDSPIRFANLSFQESVVSPTCPKESPQHINISRDDVKQKDAITDCGSLPRKVPKIYFGTRTHKQIGQIIRELKKTPYKNVKMTILSSRTRTCIHPEVSKEVNKNEACDCLRKEQGCGYYRNARKVSHFSPVDLSSAFDLEDLVGMCKRVRACPYYSSRELMSSSEIIFCPYNYLVDPLIRSSMSIALDNNIVIMDEAHNLEDAARESSSITITMTQLEEAINSLYKLSNERNEVTLSCNHIIGVLKNIILWINGNLENLTDYTSFDNSAKVWAGDEMIAILANVGLAPDKIGEFQANFATLSEDEKDPETNDPEKEKPQLSGAANMTIKSVLQLLTYLYKDSMLYVPDFRCVLAKSKSYSYGSQSGKNKAIKANPFTIALNFWCLNPAVALSDMKDIIHSLIVASGTLSPLSSFQSELGMPFEVTLEANHVISKDQMWVGTISRGPNESLLNATYRNAETFSFQDGVGNLVLQVCSKIPYGVLCFLPSYSMLNKLVSRWEVTGLLDKLSLTKTVVCEPRGQSGNFDLLIAQYYDAIKECENSSGSSLSGAILFAVCRGKVSEGLDFADNNARAVITIGIPFPNIKDANVDLKRKYNDFNQKKKEIMSGSDWYETQAFRALNQALGRCIRHRNDFGALIIVDERFQKNSRYVNALPKWIRKEICHFLTFQDAMSSLEVFAEKSGLTTTDFTI